jgi:hypothetical protein
VNLVVRGSGSAYQCVDLTGGITIAVPLLMEVMLACMILAVLITCSRIFYLQTV